MKTNWIVAPNMDAYTLGLPPWIVQEHSVPEEKAADMARLARPHIQFVGFAPKDGTCRPGLNLKPFSQM
jgi:hypothetical protein